jgi:hypothetical protein
MLLRVSTKETGALYQFHDRNVGRSADLERPQLWQVANDLRGVDGRHGDDLVDHAVTDADVAPAAQLLARVEHVSAFDHKIEFVSGPHCGMDPNARAGKCNRASGCQKIPT